MTRYVALLRAVNVAGHTRIPTAEIALLLTAAGALDATSFGHAGNFLFSAPRGATAAIVARFRTELGRLHGERPVVVLRTAEELAGAVGSSRATLFRRYRNRQVLVSGVWRGAAEAYVAATDAARLEEGPPDDALRRLIAALAPL